MSVDPGRGDVQCFRAAIARHLGLQFADGRLGFLGEVMQRRLARLDMPAPDYLRALAAGALPKEAAALAEELTVGETYFFRNSEQFRALVDVVVPAWRRRAPPHRNLAVLSAGCASGEEAYSLAIALQDALPTTGGKVEIRAVDLNRAALAKAARRRYSPWALRETPADIRRRWFQSSGREIVLADNLRAGVHFENRNLACDDAALWRPRSFDVVFCRNVIMYFAPDQARRLLTRLAGALRPGGYLFLGHAETLRGLSDGFAVRQSHGTFYYQLKDDAATPAAAACTANPPLGDWIDTIRDAAARVAGLATQATEAAAARWDLAATFDLLRGERFSEALALIDGLPKAAAADPDVLLLTATALAHGGQPTAAEAACRRLLAVAARDAGAHYVLALCREAVGEAASAAEHDRIASYLDGSFAMPRLHLGLLSRRTGDHAAARRELAQALVLLRREEPLRLLLFGGGFGRAGLISLCAAALRDCGGNA